MRENCLTFGCGLSSDKYIQAQTQANHHYIYLSIYARTDRQHHATTQATSTFIHRYIYTPPHRHETNLAFIHIAQTTSTPTQAHENALQSRATPSVYKYISIALKPVRAILTPTADNGASQQNTQANTNTNTNGRRHSTNAQTITPSAKHIVNTCKTRHNRTTAHEVKQRHRAQKNDYSASQHEYTIYQQRTAHGTASTTQRKADHKPTADRTDSTRTRTSQADTAQAEQTISIYLYTYNSARTASQHAPAQARYIAGKMHHTNAHAHAIHTYI